LAVNYKKMRSPFLIRAVLVQAFVLALLGVLLAVAFNAVRPNGLAWLSWRPPAEDSSCGPKVSIITPKDAMELWTGKQALFVDARDESLFAEGRIPGAISLPLSLTEVGLKLRMAQTPKEKTIVVYCEGPVCQAAEKQSNRLADMGFTSVRCMREGVEGWAMAGGEMEAGW